MKPFQFHYTNQTIMGKTLGSGFPLVFLHGWGSSSDVFYPLAIELSTIRTCYLIDLPGFGLSHAPNKPWNLNDYSNLISTFIADYIKKPTDIIAHSFGGRIVLKLLSDMPKHIEIYRVLITGGAGLKYHRSWSFYSRVALSKTLKSISLCLPEKTQKVYLSILKESIFWKKLGSRDYNKLKTPMRETFVSIVNEFFDDVLSKITHEILLIWGKNDTETPLYQAEKMQKYLPNAHLIIIENAGHYAFLNAPIRFHRIASALFSAK